MKLWLYASPNCIVIDESAEVWQGKCIVFCIWFDNQSLSFLVVIVHTYFEVTGICIVNVEFIICLRSIFKTVKNFLFYLKLIFLVFLPRFEHFLNLASLERDFVEALFGSTALPKRPEPKVFFKKKTVFVFTFEITVWKDERKILYH